MNLVQSSVLISCLACRRCIYLRENPYPLTTVRVTARVSDVTSAMEWHVLTMITIGQYYLQC
jgi:hypothetical protein